MTVVELPGFIEQADKILGEKGHERLVLFLAANPEAGAVIPATGGVRKLRWIAPGQGKRGGTRVIYYFHSEELPLFALDLYAKSGQGDLSEHEKRMWKLFVEKIQRNFRRNR